MRVSRIIVERTAAETLTTRFVERVSELKVANPAGPDTAIAPIINLAQLDSIRRSGSTRIPMATWWLRPR